jgi:hypothetical protein
MLAQVTALLLALADEDNAARQAAEARLKSAVKGPNFIVALLQYIDCRNPRHAADDLGSVALAAVLLSRHISSAWGELALAQKQGVFAHLLRQFAEYESHRVLQCLAELACTVAQCAAGRDDFFWEDLATLALRCSQDRGGVGTGGVCAARRLVSFKLLAMLTDSLGARMVHMYPRLMQAVVAAITAPDPAADVRAAALTATAVALGASDFLGDTAATTSSSASSSSSSFSSALQLLPAYFEFVWKLLDFAERAAGHAVAALFSSAAAAAAAGQQQGSPQGSHRHHSFSSPSSSSPSSSPSVFVGDAVAVLTALATAIRTAADADSGLLSRADAAAAAATTTTSATTAAHAPPVLLVQKFAACHRRACELCFQVLRRDFSTPALPAPETEDFLRACVLLLGSVVAVDGGNNGAAVSGGGGGRGGGGGGGGAVAAKGGGGGSSTTTSSLFGSPGVQQQPQQLFFGDGRAAPSSPTASAGPLPLVEVPKGLFACVKLVAMTLAKEEFAAGAFVRSLLAGVVAPV